MTAAVDNLAQYPETSALPAATAKHVGCILRHDASRELLSNRAHVVPSNPVEALLDKCHVIHRTTPAYHPQTNSMVERFNRALADMLATYVRRPQQVAARAPFRSLCL